MKLFVIVLIFFANLHLSSSNNWNLIYRDDIPNCPVGVSKISALVNGDLFFVNMDNQNVNDIRYYYLQQYKNGEFTNISLTNPPPIPLRSRLNDIKIDNNGNVLIASEFGLLKWDGNEWSRYVIKDEFENYREILKIRNFNNRTYLLAESLTLKEADTNELGKTVTWIDKHWRDVLLFENDSLSLIHHIAPIKYWERAFDFYIDTDGSLWFTTLDKAYGGLCKLKNGELTEYDLFNTLGYAQLIIPMNIFGDENYIYIGVDSDKVLDNGKIWYLGLIAIYKKDGEFVTSIKLERDGDLKSFTDIAKITKIGDKILIADKKRGLYYLENNEPQIIQYKDAIVEKISNPLLHSAALYIDDFDYSDGVIYLATAVGIIYGKIDSLFTSVSDDNSLSYIKVFPNIINSSDKQLNVEYNDDIRINKVLILDVLGEQVIDDYNININNLNSINLKPLYNGKYFIVFYTNKGISVSQIVIIN